MSEIYRTALRRAFQRDGCDDTALPIVLSRMFAPTLRACACSGRCSMRSSGALGRATGARAWEGKKTKQKTKKKQPSSTRGMRRHARVLSFSWGASFGSFLFNASSCHVVSERRNRLATREAAIRATKLRALHPKLAGVTGVSIHCKRCLRRAARAGHCCRELW